MTTTVDPSVLESCKLLLKSEKFINWNSEPKPSDADLLKTRQMAEKHYAPAELAKIWGVDTETVRNIFRNESGVLKIGDKNPRHKRPYLTLRIPESVAERVHRRLSE